MALLVRCWSARVLNTSWQSQTLTFPPQALRTPMPQTSKRLARLVGLLLTAVPAAGSAQVVYDNGTPNNSLGLQIASPSNAANDFSLSQTTYLGWFDWYALIEGAAGPSTINASFDWQIWTGGWGRPQGMIAAGSVSGATGAL